MKNKKITVVLVIILIIQNCIATRSLTKEIFSKGDLPNKKFDSIEKVKISEDNNIEYKAKYIESILVSRSYLNIDEYFYNRKFKLHENQRNCLTPKENNFKIDKYEKNEGLILINDKFLLDTKRDISLKLFNDSFNEELFLNIYKCNEKKLKSCSGEYFIEMSDGYFLRLHKLKNYDDIISDNMKEKFNPEVLLDYLNNKSRIIKYDSLSEILEKLEVKNNENDLLILFVEKENEIDLKLKRVFKVKDGKKDSCINYPIVIKLDNINENPMKYNRYHLIFFYPLAMADDIIMIPAFILLGPVFWYAGYANKNFK